MRSITRLLVVASLLVGLVPEVFAQVPIPRPKRRGTRYSVKIDSAPQQAAIYLDDKRYGIVGYTPWKGRLNKGDYKLIIELQGFKPYEAPIRVERRSREFFVPLEKQVLPGKIDVQAVADPNVLGAQVLVDGQSEGTAPTIVEVPAGRHLVEVKKAGFTTFTQWVTLAEGERVTIAPTIKATAVERPKGSLLVDADVPDAEVYVDGRPQPDTTPTLIDNLEEGVHIVEVKKAPAVPWKQTVYVKGGQRTKVTATLAATIQTTAGGNVRVLSNVDGAEVWLDGTLKGTVPTDLTQVPPGVHLLEVRAKGHVPREERVTVNAGSSTIVKVELTPVANVKVKTGRLHVVSSVPEAKVFIDGANAGTAPVRDREVEAGEHFVVVQQVGYARFEEKFSIEAGQTKTIQAQLRAVGAVRFLANVAGAEVVLDGEPIGRTPFLKEDVDVGDHVVTVRQMGYFDFEQPVKVAGGETVIINANLRQIDTGPTAEDIVRIKRGLSSFGARTMPPARFTLDAALGYPYWLEARATVGVQDSPKYGWDITLGFRTYMTTWEFLLTSRVRLFEREPFSFALFGGAGGGAGLDGRNEFTAQAGALGSVTFRNLVTVTGRGYFDIWSDRLCGLPEEEDPDGLPNDGPAVCTGAASPEEVIEAGKLLDIASATPLSLQERDSGLRFYLSLVIEAAFTQRFSGFLVFEGAPFQNQRAAHTEYFTDTMFGEDPIYNGKLGVTAKF